MNIIITVALLPWKRPKVCLWKWTPNGFSLWISAKRWKELLEIRGKVATAQVDGRDCSHTRWAEGAGTCSCLLCPSGSLHGMVYLVHFLHSFAVSHRPNCTQAKVKFALCSNACLIYQSLWTSFSFSKQVFSRNDWKMTVSLRKRNCFEYFVKGASLALPNVKIW